MAGRSADAPRDGRAQAVMARAYAPYSRFRVGAVLRGANGKLYAGCNVENAAYPQGWCAEASAIAAMVADGETRIVEAVVMGERRGAVHAVRRLPPEAARVRGRQPADPSLRSARAAPHDDSGRTAAAVLRPRQPQAQEGRTLMDAAASRSRRSARASGTSRRSPESCSARASATSPRRSKAARRSPMADLPGFPRPTVGGHAGRARARRRSAARRSRCCRAARTTTSTAAPTR